MTLNPHEIILPTRSFNYAATPFNPLPETNLAAYGYLNGWITQIYDNNANDFYIIQCTDLVMNYKRFTSNPVNRSATPYVNPLGGNILFLNNDADKGVYWSDYIGFFDPLSGAVETFWDFERGFTNTCFPQGGISCHTTPGTAFAPAIVGADGWQHLITSSAGCPGTNNYGASLITDSKDGPFIPGISSLISTYQGSGNFAVDPMLSTYADLPLMFGQSKKGAAVDLGNGLIAVLTGPSTGGNGTILRIYRWWLDQSNIAGPFSCQLNNLGLRLGLIYERDLCDFLQGPRTGNYGGKLTSQANGRLVAFAHNGTEGAAFLIGLPGPFVQKITRVGGYSFNAEYTHYYEPNTGKMMFIFQNNGSVQASDASLVVSLSYSQPTKPLLHNVNATDLSEIISVRGS